MTDARHKVVLYNPCAVFYTMPLALLAIVTVDGRFDSDAESTVPAKLDGALCCGVTVLTGAPIADALRLSRSAKAARPAVPIVWGGWRPSMFGRLCLDEAGVDVTVQVNPPLELLPLARFRPHDHPLIPVERCYELEIKWRKPSS